MPESNVRIEKVSDVNFLYPYLEAFYGRDTRPFLEVAISDEKQLTFKMYASSSDVLLPVQDWQRILEIAKDFLPQEIANEEFVRKTYG